MKGLLGLSSKTVETYRLTRNTGKEKGLTPSEKSLLSLIFSKMAGADSITMEELKTIVSEEISHTKKAG